MMSFEMVKSVIKIKSDRNVAADNVLTHCSLLSRELIALMNYYAILNTGNMETA